MNIFENASKTKVRFETSKGEVSVEELWDLSLTSLDSIAKVISKELKEASEESFISKKSSANTKLELKMEIIKYVIQGRLKEVEDSKTMAEKRAQVAFFEDLLNKKKTQSLESLSESEIEAKLAALKGEPVA